MGLTHVGKISKHKGLKGLCLLKLNSGIEIDLNNLKSFYLNIESNLIPIVVEKLSFLNKEHLLVKFKDHDSREKTSYIIGKEVFIENKKVIYDQKHLSNLIGFSVIEKRIKIGEVYDFHEKNQSIIFCKIDNKEVLIPYEKEIVSEIDYVNKEIHVIIPQGLLDL